MPPEGERDQHAAAWLILLMRGLRQFAYGLLAVILGVVLADEGFSPAAIGVLITVSLLGDMVGTYVISLFADAWGRRRTLALLALFMAGTGVILGLVTSYPVLLVAAFFGTLGTTASETAPFLPIDQAMLAQVSTPERRTALFARYNLIASLSTAFGALAAGLPGLLTPIGLPLASGIRLLFGVYAALALVVVGLSLHLSPRVEAPGHPPVEAKRLRQRLAPPLHRSRGIVWRQTALFSVDALAGGLVVQSLMALFFHLRFGVPLSTLSALFFGANLLSALSFLAAVPLARRFGLLNTMVFTHLPSNVLLALVAFAPTFPLAAALLLFRQALSQMDVPTRQAYTMALVDPQERTAAASVTSLARSLGSATSPVFSGLLLEAGALTRARVAVHPGGSAQSGLRSHAVVHLSAGPLEGGDAIRKTSLPMRQALCRSLRFLCLGLFLLVAACTSAPASSHGSPTATGSALPATITTYHGYTSTVFAVA